VLALSEIGPKLARGVAVASAGVEAYPELFSVLAAFVCCGAGLLFLVAFRTEKKKANTKDMATSPSVSVAGLATILARPTTK